MLRLVALSWLHRLWNRFCDRLHHGQILVNICRNADMHHYLSGFVLQARDKQMARLLREDELGACQLELANKKVLRLAQLRWVTAVFVQYGLWSCV